jgi:hypothetical protein
MTGQERDYDEVLSRVLHSTTDRIEPVGDGLTKIQARLAEPWLKRQWWLLRNESTVLGWVLVVRCQSWFSTVRSGGAGDATADEATAAGPAGDGGRLRSLPVLGGIVAWASAKRRRETGAPRRMSVGPAMAWFRPALAVAGAVVLVLAGVFALGQIQQKIGLTSGNPSGTSSSSQSGGSGGTNGSASPADSGSPSASQTNATSAKPGTLPSGKVSPSPASASPSPSPASPSPSPSPSPGTTSPTPTQSPTTSPTPTQSPTTTPTTPTTTQAPMATDGPTASAPAGG